MLRAYCHGPGPMPHTDMTHIHKHFLFYVPALIRGSWLLNRVTALCPIFFLPRPTPTCSSAPQLLLSCDSRKAIRLAIAALSSEGFHTPASPRCPYRPQDITKIAGNMYLGSHKTPRNSSPKSAWPHTPDGLSRRHEGHFYVLGQSSLT